MSPSRTTNPRARSETSSRPRRRELLRPSLAFWFSASWTGRPSNASPTTPEGLGVTTTTGANPAANAMQATRRTIGSPATGNSSLSKEPIRRDVPAASTSPQISVPVGTLPTFPRATYAGDDLGDHGEREFGVLATTD